MMIAAPSLNKLFSVTLGKFLTVGVFNTAVTMAVIFIAKAWLGVDDVAANVSGYAIGMLCSFFLNKFWTFSHKGNTLQAAARFILVCAVAYLANLAALQAFLALELNSYLCHVLAMPFYTLVFYIGSKAMVFVDYSSGKAGKQGADWRTPLSDSGGGSHATDAGSQDNQRRNLFLLLLAFAASAVVLFYRLTDIPIELWDESRLANNALEMSKTGLSLITTFEWQPDHWNTKPPLLIWLMAIAINLVGVNELGVRLPSVLAALGTAMLVYWFVGHYLRRPVQAFLAVLIILATPGYIQIHGARSGNYDSLLTLLTTVYILCAFIFLQEQTRNKRMYFALTTIAVVLAFYTKTIQGMIFLPGIFLYALFTRQIGAILRKPYFYIGCILAAAACVSYYWIRNEIDPGYFAAVQANDLGGRYANALEGHHGSPLWYLFRVKFFPWLVPSLLMAAYLLVCGSAAVKRLTAFLAMCLIVYLVVISSAGTKLVWYAMPLAPLSAILCALGFSDIAARLRMDPEAAKPALAIPLGVALAALAIGLNALLVHKTIALKQSRPYDQHSFALRSLAGSSEPGPIAVLHPGYPVGDIFPFYAAPTLFYANALTLAGTPTTIVQHATQAGRDARLLVCGNAAPVPGWTISKPLAAGTNCALHVPAPDSGQPGSSPVVASDTGR
ncbi:glycosyltransferase family 39 protein [Pseudoduganella sp. SL102]|uniref:GtrA family protein n=1 Tax=Pseudoduganella sp. SL102 TaxID=2995154 RepID=UPI00248BF3C3|nr:GtrA family protein [Pseudoduganella sp. SL102]WBS04464.1 glycosyltransferase family 39 protein [Pseudoduganella sp. SL102]